MAITLYGVDPSIDEAHWSKLLAILGRCSGDEMVDTGLVPSPNGTNRAISVTLGNAVAAGVLAESTTSASLNLDTNGTGNSRIDYVVLQIDWSGSSTTGGTIRFVKGTPAATPVAPTLTRTAGTTWHIPLARVTVRPSVTTIAAGDVELCRPLARTSKTDALTVSAQNLGTSASDVLLDSLDVADPGWPYRLMVSARVSAEAESVGNLRIKVTCNGSTLDSANCSPGNAADAVIASSSSGIINGATTVQLLGSSINTTSTQTVNGGRLTYLLVPA